MDYYENFDINQTVKLIHGTKKGLFFGPGAMSKIGEILDDMKPSCVGFVTSPSAYKKCGAYELILKALEERKVPHLLYDKIMTNPTTTVVDEAVKMFKPKYDEHQNQNCRQLYKFEFAAKKRANLVMINITHGTGTECDRFAVVSILEGEEHPYKPALASDVIYPDYSIDDVSTQCLA